MTLEPVPVSERSTSLKAILKELLEEISRVRNTELRTQSPYVLNIHGITFPWTVHDDFRTSDTESAKKTYQGFGVDGEGIVERLRNLLENDVHLRKCCVNPLLLSKLLDLFIEHVLVENQDALPSDNLFDKYFDEFTSQVYTEPFRFSVFSHVFNLSSYTNHLDFGPIQIRQLSPHEIPYLFDESTTQSLLHPWQAGQYFVVNESQEFIEDDLMFMSASHEAAEDLVRIFQYYKDGVIHLNYSANFFRPVWLNRLRKYGSLYWGDNRRLAYEQGERMYEISEEDYKTLKIWWNLFCMPEVQKLFGDERTGLGKTIEFAGTYFESSHTQIDSERKLIDLAIALEAAFSPGNKDEVTFQLSQFCAEFVGKTPSEKQDLFQFVKSMYSKRSNLLHGNHKDYEKKPVTIDELERFSSIMRTAMLKFVALYIDGEEDHKRVIEQIKMSLFDPAVREALQNKAKIERVITNRLQTTS